MTENAWRKTRFPEALARDDLRHRARQALARGPLCDACLGRLFAAVDTGLANARRGRLAREAVGAEAAIGSCHLCHDLFDAIGEWVVRARTALEGWEFDTLAMTSHADPDILARETALWEDVGGDLAESYRQAFNRTAGLALLEALGCEADLVHPDIFLVADHRTGEVSLRVVPLFVRGRYRKLARGLPQCRWRAWPTSIQQLIGDPVREAAAGEDHVFHGCGREDTDVRCLGERPFVLEVTRPHRRHLDWNDLARRIGQTGQVEALDLTTCRRPEIARIKSLRPEKTYRALARLAEDVDETACARLADLVGIIRQRTPHRVLKRRANRLRRRRVRSLEWQRLDGRTLVLTVRAQAGTYIKELVSGDEGRTRPSATEVLGVTAECAELDVLAIHLDG